MGDVLVPGVNHLLLFTGGPTGNGDLLADARRYSGIAEMEHSLAIPEGTPIIINPDFEMYPELTRYFTATPHFLRLKAKSKAKYASHLRVWLDWLWHGEVSTRWDEADEGDYARFMADMLHGSNTREPVTGATFNTYATALSRFYGWAVRRDYVEESPVPDDDSPLRAPRSPRSTHARRSRSQWVTPATYAVWRDVGLRGHVLKQERLGVKAGGLDPAFKGRTSMRTVAFCDLAITTALRQQEMAALLLLEIPTVADQTRLASATAKFGKPRMWTPTEVPLSRLRTYVTLERAAAVRRAQRSGRYEDLRGAGIAVVVVDTVSSRDSTDLVTDDGELLNLDRLTLESRMRLFRETPDGLEPLMVWLSDSGLPMGRDAWRKAFSRANDRLRREYERIGRPTTRAIHITAHTLRFSFALYLLAAEHRRIDRRLGTESAPYNYERYERAYLLVRDMLGHSSVETTKYDYLEPVTTLRHDALLTGNQDRSINDIVESIAKYSDEILDARSIFTIEQTTS